MNAQHYAVVVGINRYPGLSDLTGARADADAFAEWLEREDGGGLPPANVKRVIASDEEEASFVADVGAARPVREQIEDALSDVAAAVKAAVQANGEAWEWTRVYLYVAGHGLAPNDGWGALYLANAREGTGGRHLELEDYRRWCAGCAYFREMIVFADCCRTRRSETRAQPPTLDPCTAAFVNRQTTSLVGWGSGLGEPTYEDEARGHFTKALLEGLENAPGDEAGALTARELAPYVESAVAEQTKHLPHQQTAEFWGNLTARLVFRSRPPAARARREVTISFPPGYAGRVELRRGLQPIHTYEVGADPWTLSLEEGRYELAAAAGEPPATFAENGVFNVVGGDARVQL